VTLVKSVLTIGLDCSDVIDDIVEADPLVYSDFLPKVATVGVSETFEAYHVERESSYFTQASPLFRAPLMPITLSRQLSHLQA
jgi:hypothetical protein